MDTKRDTARREIANLEEQLHEMRKQLARTERKLQRVRETAARSETVAERSKHLMFRTARQLQQEVEQRKDDAEKLRHAMERAEEAAVAKSAFLANMSHEIRTPMTGLLGMLELLGESSLNHDQQDYLDTARSSASSLLMLLDDILDFSKLEAGQMGIERVPFTVHDTVDDVCAVLEPTAREKGISLWSEFSNAVPAKLRGAPRHFRQILSNLISNAVKFTEHGFVRVVVGYDTDTQRLHVSINDTGIGIPPDRLRTIFEPFLQADVTVTRRFGGTGLGLSIVQQLVDLNDGELDVVSTPNVGSTFSFWLPMEVTAHKYAENESISGRRVGYLAASDVDSCVFEGIARTLACEVAFFDGADRLVDSLMAGAIDCAMVPSDVLTVVLRRLTRAQRLDLGNRIVEVTSDGVGAERRHPAISCRVARPMRRRQVEGALERALDLEAKTDPHTYDDTLRPFPRCAQRVLIAEDNAVNRIIAEKFVLRAGYECDLVEDGQQAVEAVLRGRYAVLLMDCQMPVMDGFTATRMIRSHPDIHQQPIIIAMTAHALAGDRESCLAAGMDDYISKPIDSALLQNLLERYAPKERTGVSARAVTQPILGARPRLVKESSS